MKVKDILRLKGEQVVTITPDSTAQEASEKLVRESIGALIVAEGSETIGIVTERDILRACARKSPPLNELSVRSVMTADLIVGDPDDDVEKVMAIMTQKRIRHLPILVAGRLSGIVSIGDVVKSQLHESNLEVHSLREYIHGGGV